MSRPPEQYHGLGDECAGGIVSPGRHEDVGDRALALSWSDDDVTEQRCFVAHGEHSEAARAPVPVPVA